SEVRIVLLEGADRLLAMLRPRLSRYAHHALERLGLDVQLGALVDAVDHVGVRLHDGRPIETDTVVWTAGVRPADLTTRIADAPHTRRGRFEVDDRLRVVGRTDVFAIGDS